MRVAVFGYQSWGHRTLSAVINAGHEVVLVVTHPASDHPYEQMWADSVEELASEHELQVCVTERVGQDVIEALRDAAPDIIVANNWRTWLPPEVFSLAKHGALNVHDGLLPEYAGFSPILWALLNRETHVGVTVHEMDEVLDGGPIVAQRAIPVGPQDTTTDLVAKTIDLIEPLVERALSDVAQGTATAQPQDPTRATYFHKRGEQESRIDFTQPAEDIALLVRAQSDPTPMLTLNSEASASACFPRTSRRAASAEPPAESPSLTREESRWSVDRPVPTCRRRRLFWIVFVSTTTRN